MDYRYVGCTEDRKLVKGTLAAASQEVAEKVLAAQGYHIFDVKPVSAFMPSRERMLPSLFSKIKPQVIITFSRQLALLLESGNDIIASLELLQVQSSNNHFKGIIGEVMSNLRGGSRFSAALGKHSKTFSNIYVQAVSVGEQSGNLEKTLRQVADYMDKDVKASKGIKNALRYPMLISVVAFAVIGVLVTFVLPSFTDLYSSLGVELPTMTRVILSTMTWLSSYGPYLMVVALLIMVLVYLYTRTPNGRLLKDRLVLKIPVMGQVSHFNELIRCCRSMSILYQAGLSMTEIMSMAIRNSNNLIIKNVLTQVQQDVIRGESLSLSMAKSDYFLPMMVQMVSVGETSGNLDVTLLAAAENYETEAEDKMRSLIGFIQPAITLGIGVVVALVALSLVTAMYSVYGQAF